MGRIFQFDQCRDEPPPTAGRTFSGNLKILRTTEDSVVFHDPAFPPMRRQMAERDVNLTLPDGHQPVMESHFVPNPNFWRGFFYGTVFALILWSLLLSAWAWI